MRKEYDPLFSLLDDISKRLVHLSSLAEKKVEAVHEDDLMKLNEILNEEQAETLAFRNLERSRVKLLEQLGLGDVALSQLSEHCPPEVKNEAALHVGRVQEHFRAYKTASEKARSLMEQSIDEIDAILASAGRVQPQTGPGYNGESTTPPPNMKTDFRA